MPRYRYRSPKNLTKPDLREALAARMRKVNPSLTYGKADRLAAAALRMTEALALMNDE